MSATQEKIDELTDSDMVTNLIRQNENEVNWMRTFQMASVGHDCAIDLGDCGHETMKTNRNNNNKKKKKKKKNRLLFPAFSASLSSEVYVSWLRGQFKHKNI